MPKVLAHTPQHASLYVLAQLTGCTCYISDSAFDMTPLTVFDLSSDDDDQDGIVHGNGKYLYVYVTIMVRKAPPYPYS